MSDVLAGYMPSVSVSDNGAGKVRVTFRANTIPTAWHNGISTGGTHYIGNTTRTATSAISAKGGTEGGGYWYDTGLTYAGTTWASGDLAYPIRQSTLLWFTAVALALASGSVLNGDVVLIGYQNTTLNPVWTTSHNSNAKGLSFVGAISGRLVTFWMAGANVYSLGFNNAYTSLVQNLTFCSGGIAASYGTAGVIVSTGSTVTVDKCLFAGCSGAAFLNGTGTLTCTNCMLIYCNTGIRASNSAAGTVTAYNCTSFGSYNAFGRSAGTAVFKNCAAYSFGGACFFGSNDAACTNNASNDGTAPGANAVDLRVSNAKFLAMESTSFPASAYFAADARVKAGSALLGAGTNVSLAEDIDGNAVSGSYPIGCSNGVVGVLAAKALSTATPAGLYVPPSVADVRPVTFGVSQTGTLANLDGTESAYQTLEASRNTDPGVANVLNTAGTYKILNVTKTPTFDEAARNNGAAANIIKLGETIKQRNVDYVGTYAPDFSDIPDAPTITAVTVNASSVTIAFAAATETDRVYLRYRTVYTGGAWSAESETLALTGSGTITVSGLTAHVRHEFILYAKAEGLLSHWSTPVMAEATPMGSATPAPEAAMRTIALDSSAVRDLIASRLYPLQAPQKAVYPLAIMNRISSDYDEDMDGASDDVQATNIQLDVFAEEYAECKAVAAALREALNGFSGTVTVGGSSIEIRRIRLTGEQDGFDNPTNGKADGIGRVIQDYEVWFI